MQRAKTDTLILIVEGHGDVQAAPILLRKWLEQRNRSDLTVGRPKRAGSRNDITKPGGLEMLLGYVRLEPTCAAALVLLDADEDCPRDLAVSLAERSRALNLPFLVAIVCANREYEAWFLASLPTLAGKHPKLKAGLSYDGPVEAKQGVKEWLTAHMPPGQIYKEVRDQPAMTAALDFELVRQRSRSFRRLEHALAELLHAIDHQLLQVVTPLPLPSEHSGESS